MLYLKKVFMNGYEINLSSPNNFLLTKDFGIIKVKEMSVVPGGEIDQIDFIGEQMSTDCSAYTYSLDSKILHVYKVQNVDKKNYMLVPASNIVSKVVFFPIYELTEEDTRFFLCSTTALNFFLCYRIFFSSVLSYFSFQVYIFFFQVYGFLLFFFF